MGVKTIALWTFMFTVICYIVGVTINDYMLNIPGMLGIILGAVGVLMFILGIFTPGRHVGTSHHRSGDVDIRTDYYVEDGGQARRESMSSAASTFLTGVFLLFFWLIANILAF